MVKLYKVMKKLLLFFLLKSPQLCTHITLLFSVMELPLLLISHILTPFAVTTTQSCSHKELGSQFWRLRKGKYLTNNIVETT
jgi:hypothetical protein